MLSVVLSWAIAHAKPMYFYVEHRNIWQRTCRHQSLTSSYVEDEIARWSSMGEGPFGYLSRSEKCDARDKSTDALLLTDPIVDSQLLRALEIEIFDARQVRVGVVRVLSSQISFTVGPDGDHFVTFERSVGAAILSITKRVPGGLVSAFLHLRANDPAQDDGFAMSAAEFTKFVRHHWPTWTVRVKRGCEAWILRRRYLTNRGWSDVS